MNRKFFLLLYFFLVFLSQATARVQDSTFQRLNSFIQQKNFFKATEMYEAEKAKLSGVQQKLVEVYLDNAFNRFEVSNFKINRLLNTDIKLPDSTRLKLYKTKADNAIKLFEYKTAAQAFSFILHTYPKMLTEEEKKGMENALTIWTTLSDVPKQSVVAEGETMLKMHKDKAGLNNLNISANLDSLYFIFDTGANLSAISESMAQKMNMYIFPASIKVTSITGEKVSAKLAVCTKLKFGNIQIANVVFLVFPDKALFVPSIDYQINGILGYPVIQSLKEVQITQDGYFIVPQKETIVKYKPNMAMNGLMPLLYINGMHFSFDTGAEETLLYAAYYHKYRDVIERDYKPVKVAFAGLGGKKIYDGYIIRLSLSLFNKDVVLENINLLKETIKTDETVYGNIGQDLIKKFNKMTINFQKMVIRFE